MNIRALIGGLVVTGGVAGGLVVAGVLTGGPATRLVATTGTDAGNCASAPCLTLNYAYSQATGGDTIQMAAGAYGNQTINYRAAVSSAVTIRPATGATVTVQDGTIQASYVTVTGPITFRTLDIGDGNTGGPQRITNIALQNVNVDHNDSTSPTRIAMRAWAADNVSITGGSIGDTLAGASVGQESNLIQFSGQPLSYNTNWTINGVRFYDNDTAIGSAAHNECIYTVAVVGLTVKNSRFEGCTYYGMFFTDFLNGAPSLRDVTIEGNLFHTGHNASGVNYGFGLDFNDNVAPNNFKFRYNTIENAAAFGYAGTLTNGFDVRGNIIGQGVYTRFDGSFACKAGITFAYNVMPNACGSNTTTATEAAIRAGWASPSGTWGVADDFHLITGSPAIGAGDPGDFPSPDFDAIARVAPPDAGALKYIPVIPSGSANVWVDTSGGTCQRSPSQIAYPNNGTECGSPDAAFAAASAGDTIRVKAGTYGSQSFSGSKASTTQVLAEDGTTIANLNVSSTNLVFDNFTVSGDAIGLGGTGNTVKRMLLHNLQPDVQWGGSNNTWQGGEFGFAGWNPTDRSFCGASNEPVEIKGATNPTIDGVNFYGNDIDPAAGAACQHMEYIRIDEAGTGATIRNSWFEGGDGSDTATVLITNPSGGATYSNYTFSNNFVGSNASSAGALDAHENITGCTNWHILYNTFVAYPYSRSTAGGGGCSGASLATWVLAGNLGPFQSSSGCEGTHVKNRWQGSIAGSCGSDTWTVGPAFSVSLLGFNTSTGVLNAGSVAINAAETDGASDYCTAPVGPNGIGGVDHEGTVRPQGAACDNGWDER